MNGADRAAKATLTEGGIGHTLVRLTGPMLIGMLAIVGFNVVDTYFIGRLGTEELAAMGFTFPVILLVGTVSMGLGIGTASVVARAIGRGDVEQVRRVTTDALSLAFMMVIPLSVTGLLTIDPLFRALGASQELLPLIRQYMVPWYLGAPVVVIPMVGNSAIRATGDTKTPATIMVTAMAVNVLLDPVLIFGLGPFPEMGLRGAALATVSARAVAVMVSLWVIVHREKMLTAHRPSFAQGLESWKKVLYVGVPAGVTNMIVPLSMGVVTRLVSVHGVEAVAGFGVGTRLEMLPIMVINALGSVMVPFVGQNWGAGLVERVRKGVSGSFRFSLAMGVVAFVFFVLLGRPLAGLFDDDPQVIRVIYLYVGIVSASYGLQGVLLLAAAALNALNRPWPGTVLSAARMFALYVPLGYAGSVLFGVPGIFVAGLIANAVTGVAAWAWFRRVFDSLVREQEAAAGPLVAERAPA